MCGCKLTMGVDIWMCMYLPRHIHAGMCKYMLSMCIVGVDMCVHMYAYMHITVDISVCVDTYMNACMCVGLLIGDRYLFMCVCV